MAKVPGMYTDRSRLENAIQENRHLTALLAAILEVHGPLVLTKEQAEKSRGGGTLKSEILPDGSLRLWVEGLY